MARDVKEKIKGKLEGSIVYFSIRSYPPSQGGGQTVRGPYFSKPKIQAVAKATTVIEKYALVKIIE
jgi:hypothetical protein